MKLISIAFILTALGASPLLAYAKDEQAQVYINQNIGFNVPGYKYEQNAFPCEIDKKLVAFLVEDGRKSGLEVTAVGTAEKIQNGKIPVIAIDIEQLVLNKDFQMGARSSGVLPKVQVTAAVIKGDGLTTAKHTCAIATLNEFTPSSSVLDLGTNVTVCDATHKCLKDLSKDIVEWFSPQVR